MHDVAVKWIAVATLDDLWAGDILGVEVEGEQILLVYPEAGTVRAYQGVCPHQQALLADGDLHENILTCSSHHWQFDLTTGQGVNPQHCRLYRYEVKLENQCIYVGIPQDSQR
ncbi:MAG: Rieske 2Fe-2S domain-containing protein, partial [Chloroflexi bacterium]